MMLLGQIVLVGIEHTLEKQWLLDDNFINHLKYIHSAFEKDFCANLKNSGLIMFSDIHGCSFKLLHDPVKINTLNEE